MMSGLFSTPQTPAIPPPVRMPVQGSPADAEAARQAQQRLLGMPGRESTDLTGPGSGTKSGYTGTVLGA